MTGEAEAGAEGAEGWKAGGLSGAVNFWRRTLPFTESAYAIYTSIPVVCSEWK